jgi:Na+/H+-dicarboxylate symporter
MSDAKRRVPLVVWIVAAIAAGVVTGLTLGPRAAPLGELGAIVVRLLKALATPLVFFAIVDALVQASLPPRQGLRLLAVCLLNAAVAGVLAVTLGGLVRPGAGVTVQLPADAHAPAAPPRFALASTLADIIPESVAGPFVRNQVLAVVLLAVIVGVALRRLRAQGTGHRLTELVGEGFKLLTLVLGWVVDLVPLAVFGVLARIVGTTGFGLFASLGKLVATVAFGLFVHVAVWYTLLVVVGARRDPRVFYRAAAPAMLTALSTGSSMATLPVTLKTLEDKLGVSPASARLAACIGTNFNNDGIMLYEVVAALFVAQLAGIHLSAGQTAAMAATSALAAAGIAGVPEAGLITLSLVLHASNLPLTALPVLLSVDWLLGRLRATTNVASDLTVATVLDRWHTPEAAAGRDESSPALRRLAAKSLRRPLAHARSRRATTRPDAACGPPPPRSIKSERWPPPTGAGHSPVSAGGRSVGRVRRCIRSRAVAKPISSYSFRATTLSASTSSPTSARPRVRASSSARSIKSRPKPRDRCGRAMATLVTHNQVRPVRASTRSLRKRCPA